MATTRIIPMHINKGKTIAQCLSDRTEYAMNPDKTEAGEFVSSFACDPKTADMEFLLSKRQYRQLTGRTQQSDVIAYQVRQSFKPGEVTPEQANRIGYEFARRFLKGEHAFLVATHTDKHHIHNHIIWNSTSHDCQKKFRDFHRSGQAVRKLSDLQRAGYEIKIGANIVFTRPGQKQNIRLKSLGEDYSEDALRAVIAGTKIHNPQKKRRTKAKTQRPSLLSEIETKIHAGRGAAYDQAMKVIRLKSMAETLLFLQQHDFRDYTEFAHYCSEVTGKTGDLLSRIKAAENRMAEISVLRSHIINYSKTREVYVGYRKAGYSKRYLSAHESDIIIHKAAKKAFDELGLKKLPTVRSLQEEYATLLAQKKADYAEYYKLEKVKRDLLIYKANTERLLNLDREETKNREHQREEK